MYAPLKSGLFLILTVSLAIFSSCSNKSEAETVREILIGEWKITDYSWRSLSENLDEGSVSAYQDAVNLQKRRFQEFSNFEFNEDKTYRMDFVGDGGDIGSWTITDALQLAHQSERYKTTDTVRIVSYSADKFELAIEDSLQQAIITISRK